MVVIASVEQANPKASIGNDHGYLPTLIGIIQRLL